MLDETLFSEDDIGQALTRLSGQLTTDYAGCAPVLVTVLRGGFMFLADLMRAVRLPLSVDFLAVSAYGPHAGDLGTVQVLKDLQELIAGRDVIVVEDIIDTGLTLNYLLELLRAGRPNSLSVCTLLDRSVRRIAQIDIEYTGFAIPDVFVVGYGLDYQQRFRELPYIAKVKIESSS